MEKIMFWALGNCKLNWAGQRDFIQDKLVVSPVIQGETEDSFIPVQV